MSANWQRPRVRVDARLLEATLLNLRKRIAAIPLVFDIPGTDEVTAIPVTTSSNESPENSKRLTSRSACSSVVRLFTVESRQ